MAPLLQKFRHHSYDSATDTESTAEPLSPTITWLEESFDLLPPCLKPRRADTQLRRCRSLSPKASLIPGSASQAQKSRARRARSYKTEIVHSSTNTFSLSSCTTFSEMMLAYESRGGRVGQRRPHMVFAPQSRLQDKPAWYQAPNTMSPTKRSSGSSDMVHAVLGKPRATIPHVQYAGAAIQRQQTRLKFAREYHRYKAWSESIDSRGRNSVMQPRPIDEWEANARKYHMWKHWAED